MQKWCILTFLKTFLFFQRCLQTRMIRFVHLIAGIVAIDRADQVGER